MAERKADASGRDSGDDVAAYATECAADVVSADGRTAGIRPIRPDDNEPVLCLYECQSRDSMYLRFFSLARAPVAPRLSGSLRSTRASTS
jgi:hypothetical protein